MKKVFVTREIPAAGLKPLEDRARVVVSPLNREFTSQERIDHTAESRLTSHCQRAMSGERNRLKNYLH